MTLTGQPRVTAPRWRDLAGPVGTMETGLTNQITDVPGLLVGHAQAESGERTGVTVVMPPRLPLPAGCSTINGTGELTAKLEIDEWGMMSTGVFLCGTNALGTVAQAVIRHSGSAPGRIKIPVVGECDDSDMADSRTVTAADVERALDALSTDVVEGTVGSGTGMACYDYPGGIGTASRRVGAHTVGVLLMCNFGSRPYLDVLPPAHARPVDRPSPHGSCIAICATDAPLSPHHLRRLSLRPLLGLARTGSYASNGSGEIALAFSTADAAPEHDVDIDPYFAAAYEAAREAVYNCLVAGEPRTRRNGEMQDRFPVEDVVAHLRGGGWA